MLKTVLSISLLASTALYDGIAHASTGIHDMVVSHGFDYANEHKVFVHLQVLDHEGQPAANRMVEVLTPNGAGDVMQRAMTDDYGVYEGFMKLPGHMSTVVVRTNVIGIVNEARVQVADGLIEHAFQ
jgi:hypothetical protein